MPVLQACCLRVYVLMRISKLYSPIPLPKRLNYFVLCPNGAFSCVFNYICVRVCVCAFRYPESSTKSVSRRRKSSIVPTEHENSLVASWRERSLQLAMSQPRIAPGSSKTKVFCLSPKRRRTIDQAPINDNPSNAHIQIVSSIVSIFSVLQKKIVFCCCFRRRPLRVIAL